VTPTIIDPAERFLSALFHIAQGRTAPDPERGYAITEDMFEDADHRAVFRTLMAFVVSGVKPTTEAVKRIATDIGYIGVETILNPNNADLIDELPYIEASAAGLNSWALRLVEQDRKRRQVARLWKRLTCTSKEPVGMASNRKRDYSDFETVRECVLDGRATGVRAFRKYMALAAEAADKGLTDHALQYLKTAHTAAKLARFITDDDLERYVPDPYTTQSISPVVRLPRFSKRRRGGGR